MIILRSIKLKGDDKMYYFARISVEDRYMEFRTKDILYGGKQNLAIDVNKDNPEGRFLGGMFFAEHVAHLIQKQEEGCDASEFVKSGFDPSEISVSVIARKEGLSSAEAFDLYMTQAKLLFTCEKRIEAGSDTDGYAPEIVALASNSIRKAGASL